MRSIWENLRGGLTYEVGQGVARQFLKWAPLTSEIDLAIEAERLLWAAEFTPVHASLTKAGMRPVHGS